MTLKFRLPTCIKNALLKHRKHEHLKNFTKIVPTPLQKSMNRIVTTGDSVQDVFLCNMNWLNVQKKPKHSTLMEPKDLDLNLM